MARESDAPAKLERQWQRCLFDAIIADLLLLANKKINVIYILKRPLARVEEAIESLVAAGAREPPAEIALPEGGRVELTSPWRLGRTEPPSSRGASGDHPVAPLALVGS